MKCKQASVGAEITDLTRDPMLVNEAFEWLIQSRKHHPPNADIWDFRSKKEYLLPELLIEVEENRYRFKPLSLCLTGSSEYRAIWSSQDAFVLKLITLGLTKHRVLPVHRLCCHVRGNPVRKGMAQRIESKIRSGFRYVYRTDIRQYYANIDKHGLLDALSVYIRDKTLLNLLSQYIFFSVEYGGSFKTGTRGISRGCPLSPLIAAFHLYHIDVLLAGDKQKVFYLRYMDDFLILAKTRHAHRRAVKILKQQLALLRLDIQPGKSVMGRVKKGFDWLGLFYQDKGVVSAAPRTTEKYTNKLRQLYEQTANREVLPEAVAQYKQNWRRWYTSMLPNHRREYSYGFSPLFLPGKGHHLVKLRGKGLHRMNRYLGIT